AFLAPYCRALLGVGVRHPGRTYEDCTGLFSQIWMRIFSRLALLAILVHAWVGMWTITTDYLTQMAIGRWATGVRFLVQALCGVLQFVMFVWGVQILWGI